MEQELKNMIGEKIGKPFDAETSALINALEQTGIYCFKYYPKLKLITVPENTCKAWNCKPYYDNMPDSLCGEFVDEAYHMQFRTLYGAFDGKESSASLVFRLKDMKTWSRVTLTTTVWGSDGLPEECIAAVENLSDSKNAEIANRDRDRALNMVMQAFQTAAEATGTIVFMFDTERQSIMVTDNTASDWGVLTEQTGVPYETAESGIVHEDSKAEYIRLHEEMMNGAMSAEGKVQLCDANGNTGYYELKFKALLDENGKPTGKAAGVYKNITESVRRGIKQEFIINSLGNTYSSVYYVDIKSGRYERIAERDRKLVMTPEKGRWEKAAEMYLNDFVDAAYRPEMSKLMDAEAYEGYLGKNERLSVEYLRTDKSWRKAFMLPAEKDAEGHISSVIFAVQKIDTEKKKALETQKALKEAYDAAQLANRAKTAFLANMSHDIRTPINAIVGLTAIAAANIDSQDKVSYCLKKITGSSKHLLGLINEILDMSKIESGRIDLNEDYFNISDLLDEVISMNRPQIEEKGHTLNVNVSHPLHEKVVGDCLRLQQVFNNLLSNAVKYTPPGGTIGISVSEKDTHKSSVGRYEFVVSDNGIGMSEEYRKTIFDPFTRANDDRISNIQGTGLGMPIARNIIRMMNGDITVESEVDKGSTFTVTFTLRFLNEDNSDYAGLVDLPVLVVDDDISACESTCTILDSLDMKSEYVTSGEEAVKIIYERHESGNDYHAVLLDWKMPGMDGVETSKEIRKRVGNDIPIIVLTAYDWSYIEDEAKAAGVNAFLSKPLFKSRLIDLFASLSEMANGSRKSADIRNLADFSGKRILLAEDNELNAEIAVDLLEMLNLEVDVAVNGKECFDKFTASGKGYYDLIFMDIQMPYMDGYETTGKIRSSSHPDAGSIPIVAMTANAFSTDVVAALDSGMNGHVAKPIEIETVANVLKEYFS